MRITLGCSSNCTAEPAKLAILFRANTAAAAAAARCYLLLSMCSYCPHLMLRFCLPGSAFLKRSSAGRENTVALIRALELREEASCSGAGEPVYHRSMPSYLSSYPIIAS